jgi:HNH endonuclease
LVTAYATDKTICQICGRGADIDRHHVIPRGMGGSKNPAVLSEENLISLCRTCHRNIHEGGWSLERSPDGLRVVNSRTGSEVMRRRYDSSFDASAFLALMDRLESSLSQALSVIPYLDDEQLVAAFRDSRSLGRKSWVLQAAILHEAQKRSIHGDRSLEAIARRFEVSLRQAQKYALVWSLFFERNGDGSSSEETIDSDGAKNVNVDAFLLDEPSWYLVAASESPDPRRWLAYAQDKKAENAGYSISEFRREIQRAVQADGSAIHAPARKPVAVAPRINWSCPWVKPYCSRSGLPVPAEQCRCEA